MSDFFDRVVARAKGAEPAIRPRMPSRFEAPDQRLVLADTPAAPEPAPGDAGADEGAAARRRAIRGPQPPADAPAEPVVIPARDAPVAARTGPDERKIDRATSAPFQAPAPTLAPAPPTAIPVSSPVPPLAPVAPVAAMPDSMGPLRPARVAPPEPEAAPVVVPHAAGGEPVRAAARRTLEVLQEIYSPSGVSPSGVSPSGVSPSFGRGPSGEAPSAATLARFDDSQASERRQGMEQAPADAQGAREITIAIDRIEVRGLAPAPRPAKQGRPGPRLTLGEYMRQSGQGKR